MDTTMNAKDAVSAKLATAYVEVGTNRYLLFQGKNLEANFEKNKSEVAILGKTGVGHKSTGWNGTGSLTIYKNTNLFDDMCSKYKETGEDVYFDLQIINEDPTSAAGRSDKWLLGCNIDGAMIASFDADGEWLEQDVDFTFEDFRVATPFTELAGFKIK